MELNITDVPDQLSDAEFQVLLNDFWYCVPDWDRNYGECTTLHRLQHEFMNEESARVVINRILVAVKRMKGE